MAMKDNAVRTQESVRSGMATIEESPDNAQAQNLLLKLFPYKLELGLYSCQIRDHEIYSCIGCIYPFDQLCAD